MYDSLKSKPAARERKKRKKQKKTTNGICVCVLVYLHAHQMGATFVWEATSTFICVLYRYSIWRLTHTSFTTHTLVAVYIILLLIHCCLARLNVATFVFSLSFTSAMSSAYVWIAVSRRVCVCLCTQRWIYSIFWPSFIDFSFFVRQTHKREREREMLEDASSNLMTTSCVCKFVAKRFCMVYMGHVVVAVPMINSMHKAMYARCWGGICTDRISCLFCWAIVGILVFIICKIRRQSFSHQINT